MSLRWLILFAVFGAAGCAAPIPPRAASLTLGQERNHLETMAGVSFDVPDTWTLEDDGVVRLLHGPAGTDAFYATLAVQARLAPPEQRLDEAVALGLAAVSGAPGFMWDNLSLDAFGQDLALGYSVRFNALEVLHRQTGVVFVHNDRLVAITLSAPSELFDSAAPVFQRALDSLSMLPCVVRPAAPHAKSLGPTYPPRPH